MFSQSEGRKQIFNQLVLMGVHRRQRKIYVNEAIYDVHDIVLVYL